MPRKPKHGGTRPGAGRPPLGNSARTCTVRLRLTELERAEWTDRAGKAGQSLSDWIRARVERQ